MIPKYRFATAQRLQDMEQALHALLRGIKRERQEDPWFNGCDDLRRAEEHAIYVLHNSRGDDDGTV